MPQIKSSILFNGNESERELVQKIADMQRQLDNRIFALEDKMQKLEDLIFELEG